MPSLQPYGGKGWTLACLLPPSSISLYANILLKLESAQRGISRETLHLSVNSQSPFSAATVFQMLLLDVILYAVLTWYFDQVRWRLHVLLWHHVIASLKVKLTISTLVAQNTVHCTAKPGYAC